MSLLWETKSYTTFDIIAADESTIEKEGRFRGRRPRVLPGAGGTFRAEVYSIISFHPPIAIIILF